jgi:excisionase family DNA binding protein
MLRVPTKSTLEHRGNMQVIARDKEVLTAKEAAKKLRVTPRTVQNMAASGALPAFRVGRLWRFDAEAVHELMETPRRNARTQDLVEAEKLRAYAEFLGIRPDRMTKYRGL